MLNAYYQRICIIVLFSLSAMLLPFLLFLVGHSIKTNFVRAYLATDKGIIIMIVMSCYLHTTTLVCFVISGKQHFHLEMVLRP